MYVRKGRRFSIRIFLFSYLIRVGVPIVERRDRRKNQSRIRF